MPSLGFLMIRVLTASPAELLELQTIWSRFLVLRRYVIAALAITALQYNVIAWHYSTSPISNLKSEIRKQKLFDYIRDRTGAHRAAAFTDREAQPLLHRNRRDQLNLHLHIVAGHHHLYSLRQVRDTGNVSCPKVKLRPVTGKERRVPAAFFLGQHGSFSVKLRVWREAPGRRDDLAPLDVLALASP